MKKAFSVIEVILASGLFVIIVAGVAIILTQGWDANRLGLEQTLATQYATEGLEEARRLRNISFASLVDGTTNSTFDKYSRAVIISTVDAQTKKIESSVGSVTLVTYLTDWKSNISTTTTCPDYCIANAYTGGTCRSNVNQCNNNSETNLPGGDQFCTHVCCCSGSTVTPTPTPTPVPGSCTSVCVANSYSVGTCRANVNQCNNNSETNVSAGNVYCTGGNNADTCCCAP